MPQKTYAMAAHGPELGESQDPDAYFHAHGAVGVSLIASIFQCMPKSVN
jgi:hypothetical protein